MGNHWGSGRDKESAGPCAVAVRALAASAVIAVSFFAVGLPGTPRTPVSAPGAGSVSLPGLEGGFRTDSRALVPFSRTIVTTLAKDGHVRLNVASAGLKRPPEGSLMAPLEVLRPSSPFGYRISPLSGAVGDFHLGQDYAAGCGTRVYSADAGVVRAAGWHPWGGGNRVEIDHGNGLITTYNHLEAIAVRAGDSIQVGQVIARVGTTGWSTGCHLHFETILHGRHTNPANWTLLPLRQVDELADLAMVSYDGRAPGTAETQRWAIPVADDHSHTVLNGEQELASPPVPDPTAGTTPESTETATPAPTTTQAETEPPTQPGTATPTTTATSPPSASSPPTSSSPSGTASDSPTPTHTPTPSPTGTSTTPVPTATSPTATATATPSATPTAGTTWPGWLILTSPAAAEEPPDTESATTAFPAPSATPESSSTAPGTAPSEPAP
jgi:hypothetical protein